MQILVDADACPVKQIIVQLAKENNIPVIMLIDTSHEINDGYSRVITVDRQADSVDFALMGLLTREDIVLTQDFGLAAMVIGRRATQNLHFALDISARLWYNFIYIKLNKIYIIYRR